MQHGTDRHEESASTLDTAQHCVVSDHTRPPKTTSKSLKAEAEAAGGKSECRNEAGGKPGAGAGIEVEEGADVGVDAEDNVEDGPGADGGIEDHMCGMTVPQSVRVQEGTHPDTHASHTHHMRRTPLSPP